MTGRNRQRSNLGGLEYEAFWYAEYRSVVGLAYVLVGNEPAAEELTQEAFAEALINWDAVSHYEKPEAWIRRVLVNKSRSRFRKLKTEATTLTKLRAAPRLNVELPDRSDEIWNAVRNLPKRQAQAIALRYWDGFSVAEIAEILECGPETVKTHLQRGRSTLADRLGTVYDPNDAHTIRVTSARPREHRRTDPEQRSISEQKSWS